MDQKERKEFEQLFQECYEYSRKHLVPIIGNKIDFEEVFMEAISRYWMRTKQGKVKHQTNVKAFVFGKGGKCQSTAKDESIQAGFCSIRRKLPKTIKRTIHLQNSR